MVGAASDHEAQIPVSSERAASRHKRPTIDAIRRGGQLINQEEKMQHSAIMRHLTLLQKIVRGLGGCFAALLFAVALPFYLFFWAIYFLFTQDDDDWWR